MNTDTQNTNAVSGRKRIIAIVALVLALGFATVFLLRSSRQQASGITLHFAGFTNTGTRAEALFAVSNHPGGYVMQAMSIDRIDGSRWIRDGTSSIPVVPYSSPVKGPLRSPF